jgi:hypothetical protein
MLAESHRQSKLMINRVMGGKDPMKVVAEALADENEFATFVGLGLGDASSKLGEMGFTHSDSKDFPGGSVQIFTSGTGENPGEMARVYVALGSDGTVKLAQQDGTPNLDPEAIDTAMVKIATQLGLTRPAGSTAQPGDGGVGYVPGQA